MPRTAYPDPRQHGIALITALVVVAIATGLAAAIIWQTGLDTRRTATLVQGDQAMEYALGAEAWAEQILARDAVKNQGVTDLDQDWAQQLPPLPVDGGQIQGKLEDLQGRFNINNVTSQAGEQQFQHLLQALGQDQSLASKVSQWMSTTSAAGGDATDDYYSRLQPAYLTSQAQMQSISELLLVKDITPAVYAQISPYLCALPLQNGTASGTSVNVNTASAPVLQALDSHITADLAAQVIGERGSAPFNKVPPKAFTDANISSSLFGYDSNYFMLTVVAQIGSTHVTLYSLLYRNGGSGVTAVRRTFGTL